MIGTEDARSGALLFVAPIVRSFYGRSRDVLHYCRIEKTITMGDNALNLHTSERLGNVSLRIRDIHQSVEMILDVVHFSKLATVKNSFTIEMDTTRNFRLYWKASHSKVRCHVELKIVLTLL